ncbi:MAG: sodium:solute symporter [Clostridium sp.]|nr:sodium:solute symporter [Clostridium sp.]
MTPFSIILTIAGYFAILLLASRLASRGAAADNAAFFTGGRRIPWGIVAFASLGAAISGVTFISVPGMVAAKGHSYLQMALGFVVGYLLIGSVLLPLFYRHNLVSIYGYLEQRFGRPVYKTGALFFFVSKLLGAAVRFYVVCAVLQILVFAPLGVAFEVNVAVTVGLIWLYTRRGGVKTLVWTDLIKSFCLIATVVLAIIFIARETGMTPADTISAVAAHPSSRIFYFDNPLSPLYFWKQFVAGVFLAIAMTGLDQDMMQRHLSCRDWRASRKNMVTGGIIQLGVIALFLLLGSIMVIYLEQSGTPLPDNSDELFGMVATAPGMPAILCTVFVVGLIAAAYSAAASAITSLTTSWTIDILEADRDDDSDGERLSATRHRVHIAMAAAMAAVIVLFRYLATDDAITMVYTLASYTYGPILGLFVFGLMSRRRPRPTAAAAACVAAPLLTWVFVSLLRRAGYETGFELLLINAALTVAPLLLIPSPVAKQSVEQTAITEQNG